MPTPETTPDDAAADVTVDDEGLPVISIDADIRNADWPKRTKDTIADLGGLPPAPTIPEKP